MKKRDYKELQHLWDGSDGDWILVRTNQDRPNEKPIYIIQNQRTGRLVLMGNPKLAEETIALMLSGNVHILPNP
jgi:hypothetical protein